MRSSAYATTFYVDDTRPDDTGNGLSWETAKKTVQAALDITETTGDIVEISAGNYTGTGSRITFDPTAANGVSGITVKASTAEGHSGTVILSSTSSLIVKIQNANGASLTLSNLTLQSPGWGKQTINADNSMFTLTVNDVIHDASNSDGGGGMYFYLLGGTTTFNRNTFTGSIYGTYSAVIANAALVTLNYCKFNPTVAAIRPIDTSSLILNNCLFIGSSTADNIIRASNTASTTLNNSIVIGKKSRQTLFDFGTGMTLTINNSAIYSPPKSATEVNSSSYTENNPISEPPKFASPRYPIGSISITVDDFSNLSYFETIASIAEDYGYHMALAVDMTESISVEEWARLSVLVEDGHEITAHTRNHQHLELRDALVISYALGTATLTVSGDTLTTSVSNPADNLNIDLTGKTIAQLRTAILENPNYTATVLNNHQNNSATWLKTYSNQSLPYTLEVGQGWYDDEVGGNISDIQAGIPGYTVKTLAYPSTTSDEEGRDAVAGFLESVGGYAYGGSDFYFSGDYDSSYNPGVEGMDIWAAGRLGYSTFTQSNETKFKRDVAGLVEYVRFYGAIVNVYSHTAAELDENEWTWLFQALHQNGATVMLPREQATYIRANGTNVSDEVWKYSGTLTDTQNYQLSPDSSFINAGTDVGQTIDYLGNYIIGSPDIGLWEFQTPNVPTLTQFKSDGISTINSGRYTNETAVTLKLSMSSMNVNDSLIPQVEIREMGTNFNDTVTNSGDAVAYSGTPVMGTVRITGLTNGATYHWQARVNNAAGTGSWIANGNSSDFGVDTTAPTTTDNIDSSWHSSNVTVTLTCNETGGSSCANTYYTTDGTTPSTSSSSGTSFTLSSNGIYTIKYFSVDNANNQESVKTATNTVRINKTLLDSVLTPLLANPSSNSLETITTQKEETIVETEDENQQVEEKGYTVKIRVVDTKNQPVSGAKVTIYSKVQEATTDKDGFATFNDVEQGQHKILITYANYKSEQSINLTGDVKEFNLDIEVKPKYTLSTSQVIVGVGLLIVVTGGIGYLLNRAKRREAR